jgi:SP family arabinose:H+ symporter-like MFS transporter
VMIIGVSVAILQQITGINAVFFYAPMIFEQSGLGTDASFMQAIYVGIVNVVFTLIAISLIDKIGRKALLLFGVSGIAVCMFCLAYGFFSATYTLTEEKIASFPDELDKGSLVLLKHQTFDSELKFKESLRSILGPEAVAKHESLFVSSAIKMNQTLVLVSLLGFVACFAISLGPVMWVLFSELFPNNIRGVAISFVGLINSGVSFLVQLVFPWELATLGSTFTFALYGVFAVIGLVIIAKLLPETKGKSLEELEAILVPQKT